jgi:hypothetical protein
MKNLIILTIALMGFNLHAQKAKSFPPEAFYNCWSASYEEDQANSMTKNFRSCDYDKFPPSRFRQQLTFNKDGSCKVLNLGATDAHFFSEHKWTYNKKKKTVSILGNDGKEFMKFKINSVVKDRLNVTHFEVK